MSKTIVTAIAIALASTGCASASIDHPAEQTDQALQGAGDAVIPDLPPTPNVSASTVPANGDLNPYGVAFVPPGFPQGGILRPGDVIVSNFNNSANLQGTGTTIVRVNSNASPSLFFTNAAAPGFSTALGVLEHGFVLVGNLPSTNGSGVCTPGTNGTEENVGQGELMVIDQFGNLVQTLTSPSLLNGPWDLTIRDFGFFAQVFVSNAGTGTVTRLDLSVGNDGVTVQKETQIASGYVHRCDPAAFVVAPTGVALDPDTDTLYVASAGDNLIYAVENASQRRSDDGTGRVVVNDPTHLHGPLGLARAANGDLISAQGDAVNADSTQPSEIVEFTARGAFVAEFSIDSAPGSAFGLALNGSGVRTRFAAVDDGLNVLDIWNVK
jgi:hypothetical protein